MALEVKEVGREYLHGCPKDRRSIGAHSIRYYKCNGRQYMLDRETNVSHPWFTLYGPMLDGSGRDWRKICELDSSPPMRWPEAVEKAKEIIRRECAGGLAAPESG